MNNVLRLYGARGGMMVALIAASLVPSVLLGANAQDLPAAADTAQAGATLPVLVGGTQALQKRLEYPEEARARGIGGQVLLEFMVHEDGSVSDVEVVESPDSVLSAAAVEAIEAAQWEPATRRGHPISVRHRFSVAFQVQPVRPSPVAIDSVVINTDTTGITRQRNTPADTPPVLIGGMEGFYERLEFTDHTGPTERRVFLEFLVNEDGAVSDIVVKRSPSPLYSAAAVKALEESRFEPGMHDGRPVRVRHHLTVTFRLTPDTPPLTAPEPVGGMARLQERLACPDALWGEDLAGDVSVRFDVDRDGTPVDITIRETPDERLNDSVIETIEESRWTRTNDLDRETVQMTVFVDCRQSGVR